MELRDCSTSYNESELRELRVDTRCTPAVLSRAQSHLEEPFMPSWASAVCEDWSETLELLGKNPRSLSGRLDWAIKQHFYGR